MINPYSFGGWRRKGKRADGWKGHAEKQKSKNRVKNRMARKTRRLNLRRGKVAGNQ